MGWIRYKTFRAYQAMPTPVRRVIGAACRALPRRWIMGSDFVRWTTFLNESQWWDRDRIRAYQDDQVRRLIAHAYARVPFYRREMDRRGIKPKDIETTADLSRIPDVDKNMMLENPDDFKASGYTPKQLVSVVTGGSTGTPLHFHWPVEAHSIERAFLWRVWNWAGYSFGQPAFRIRAKREVKNIHYFDAFQNTLEFYPTLIDEAFVSEVAKSAREFNPKAMFGYPSYLHAIAILVERMELQEAFRGVEVCFGASEKVFSEQRRAVERVFGAKLVEWYGMGELAALFGQCEQYGYLHDFPEHSYVDFRRQDGSPAQPGDQALMYGTSFLSYAWPIINYAIGDVVELAADPCSCGRVFRCIKEVHGRCGDFVVTPSGKIVSPTHLEFAIRFIRNVLEFQVIQTELDHLKVVIVPDKGYEDGVGAAFAEELLRRIGEPMRATVELVTEMDRPRSQKQRFIVSEFGRRWFAEVSAKEPCTTRAISC